MTVSSSWQHIETLHSDILFCVRQDFPPDGISVIVSVRRTEKGYEIWSSAEHRISGPNDHLVTITNIVEDALETAEAECLSWEVFFSENRSGNYSKPKLTVHLPGHLLSKKDGSES